MTYEAAFWLNLYNDCVRERVRSLGIRESVRERPEFFTAPACEVDGLPLSLDQIEHGVLRGNRPRRNAPAPFGPLDPRLRFVLPGPPDPRIHFALNCGARSCPLRRTYDGENLDRQLDDATRAFLVGPDVQLDPSEGEVRLSALFDWYADDFPEEPLRFVLRYLDDSPERDWLQRVWRSVPVRYLPYDWRLG